MSKKRLAYYAVGVLVLMGLQPAQADQVFLYQSAAAIEVDQITDTSGTNLSNLQPTKSDTDANRTYHDLPARVYMNGDTSTLDWIVACLYHEASLTAASVSVDTACGYGANTSDTHTGYADTNPDKVMVVAYEHENSSFSIKDGGSTEHVVDTANSSISFTEGDTTRQDTDSAALTTTRINVEFRFALSHATINDSGWKVRVSSGATSLGPETSP
jgi:hypothetical protein